MGRKIIQRTRKQAYRLWIEALRSGQYKQGKGSLRSRKKEFCCLGVLCELARKDGGPSWNHTGWDAQFLEEEYHLPKAIRQFMQLGASARNLERMNDAGKSFAEIADHIETKIMPRACKEPSHA